MLKKLTNQEWKQLQKSNHEIDDDYIQINLDLINNVDNVFDNYVRVDNFINVKTSFSILKATILSVDLFRHVKKKHELTDDKSIFDFDLNKCFSSIDKTSNNFKNMKFKCSIQHDIYNHMSKRFVKISTNRFVKIKGILGLVVEAVCFSYKIKDADQAWRVVYSLTDKLQCANVKRYFNKNKERLQYEQDDDIEDRIKIKTAADFETELEYSTSNTHKSSKDFLFVASSNTPDCISKNQLQETVSSVALDMYNDAIANNLF